MERREMDEVHQNSYHIHLCDSVTSKIDGSLKEQTQDLKKKPHTHIYIYINI